MRLEDYIEEYPKGFKLTEGVDDKGIFKAVFMGGMPGCFDGQTLIRSKDGYKFIKDLYLGELVYTFNENTGNEELKPIEDVIVYKDYEVNMLELEFENGEKVICTEDHGFFVEGKWVEAKDL